jgi:hypothetical protein
MYRGGWMFHVKPVIFGVDGASIEKIKEDLISLHRCYPQLNFYYLPKSNRVVCPDDFSGQLNRNVSGSMIALIGTKETLERYGFTVLRDGNLAKADEIQIGVATRNLFNLPSHVKVSIECCNGIYSINAIDVPLYIVRNYDIRIETNYEPYLATLDQVLSRVAS